MGKSTVQGRPKTVYFLGSVIFLITIIKQSKCNTVTPVPVHS